MTDRSKSRGGCLGRSRFEDQNVANSIRASLSAANDTTKTSKATAKLSREDPKIRRETSSTEAEIADLVCGETECNLVGRLLGEDECTRAA